VGATDSAVPCAMLLNLGKVFMMLYFYQYPIFSSQNNWISIKLPFLDPNKMGFTGDNEKQI
jgi:hypothetical protein